MKKLLRKIKPGKKQSTEASSSLRITNETVAEHRERILAGGRKFKYPLQYTKHRVVAITSILVVALLLVFGGLTAWQLYGAQDTSKFIYRITQVIPVPVAQVDGQQVRYSDYLLELRSALHYLSTKEAVNFSSDDGKRQKDYQKRLAMDKAIERTYLHRLAREEGVSVSDKERDDFIKGEIQDNNLGVTEEVYRQVIKDYYDWSFDDYRASVHDQLLRKKVLAKIDVEGRQQITATLEALVGGADFAALASERSEDPMTKAAGGDVGFVPLASDDPNGLITAANGLGVGQISNIIEGVDGFYIVRTLEKRDAEVHFAKIFISYKTFSQKLEELRANGKIKEYITVPETVRSTNQ